MKNVTPVFKWAIAHGETKIVERILIKLAPELVASNQMISLQQVEDDQNILVDAEIYDKVLHLAEALIGQTFTD